MNQVEWRTFWSDLPLRLGDRAMASFSMDVGTSWSKRKRSNNQEEEGYLKKRACDRSQRGTLEFDSDEESEEEEEEEFDAVGDEIEDDEEVEETGKDGGFSGGNKNGEFNFRIDPDVLDCSICFEPLRLPIFQCRNGHIACSYCCPKLLNKCHFCSQPIGRRRCIALEKVIESIKSPCQYAHYGCRAVPSFANKASHEERCSHAALFCPISNCTFSGSQSLLFAHAGCNHRNILKNFSYGQPFMIGLEKQQPCMVLLGEDDHFFLLLNNSHETCAGNVLSVICMAPNNPECEFSYELKVESSGSLLRLRTLAEKVRKWNGGAHPCKAFLVVPDGLCASTNAQLSLVVCICKSSGNLK